MTARSKGNYGGSSAETDDARVAKYAPLRHEGPGRQNDDGKFVGLTGFLQGVAGVAKALAPAAVNSKRKIQWVVVPGVGANFHC